MCGIAGEYSWRADRPVVDETVVPMVSVLAHRGPDEWGYYVDPQRRALLLHSRLAVVDVEHGRQPLSNEDRTIWVTFNGEIYDFQRITEELRGRGHTFRTRSDTEVIVHLYEEHGESFVDKLRGEFAFALYDQKRATLYLIRDRFGIKPLYYSAVGGTVVFASEMKALFRHPGVGAELDHDSVYTTLCSLLLPSATLFKNVSQVEPGCFLRVRTTGVQAVRYWDLPLVPESPMPVRNEQEVVEEFRGLLEEAVRLRLQGDVEAGVYLSGGVDSSSIASIMAKHSRRVKAFTIGFADSEYNEAESARKVAQRAGLDQHVLQIGRNGLAAQFVESLWHTEMPVWNSHGTAKFLLSDLARSQVKVVLSGEGADEVLLGYTQFRHQLHLEAVRREGNRAMVRDALRQFLGREGILTGITRSTEYEEYERVTALLGCYPYPALRALVCQEKFRLLLSRSFQQRTRGFDPVAALAMNLDLSKLANLHPLAATQYVLFKTDLPGYILSSLGDRAEMAHSVEGRVPFLDHNLVEFACRLPLSLKLNERFDKYVLRRAVSDLLPEQTRAIRKHVFLAPSLQTLGLGARNAFFDLYFTRQYVKEVGVFDPLRLSFIRRAIRLLPSHSLYRHVLEGALVMVLSVHVIYDLFCRRFAEFATRFSRSPLTYSLTEARVS